MEREEILTTEELAERLKVTPLYIYQLCKKGLPHYRLNRDSGEYRFRFQEVLDWLRANPKETAGGEELDL